MPGTPWGRRELLKVMSAGAAAGLLAGGTRNGAAQQVKWSTGTEPPKLKAPANSCDCHHHIYDARYPVDPKSVLRPGDALVEDYRAFQKRIGTSRNVVIQPSTYGTKNAPTLDAVKAFGPTARAVVVVDTTVTDAELKRMHEQGARGIRFNLAQAGANPRDRRSVLVRLNPTKLKKMQACHGDINERMVALLDETPDRELRSVVDLFSRMNASRTAGPHDAWPGSP